jgi:hypothetical protein
MKKTYIVLLATIFILVLLSVYIFFKYRDTEERLVYSTKERCEKVSGKTCVYNDCEVCAMAKGWVVEDASQYVISPSFDNLNVIVSEDIPESNAVSPYIIHGMDIKDTSLSLDVSYSGGCGEHAFRLYTNGSIEKSMPPIMDVVLVHDSDDACEMAVRKNIVFLLDSVSEYYDDAYGEGDELTIVIMDPQSGETYSDSFIF